MRRLLTAGLACAACLLANPPAAGAHPKAPPPTTAPPDDDLGDIQGDVTGVDSDTGPPDTLPLIPAPFGCSAPRLPHIVFIGEVVDRDYRTVRFEIQQIRSGRSAPFADDDRIDVRYGIDAQYLDDGERYLVSAVVDTDLGLLLSKVTEPIENFGGDDVIGVSETDVDCPDYEDPMRTLNLDGTPVDSSVLQPFFDARVRILTALVVPFGIALGVIFVMAMLRLSVSGLYHGIAGAGRRRID